VAESRGKSCLRGAVWTLAACLCAIGPASAGAADIRVFGTTADAYVSSAAPASAHGSLPRLVLRATPAERGLLHFEIRGLNGPVSHATLRLRAVRGSGAGFQVRFLRGRTWQQRGLTFRNAPTQGAVIASSGRFAAGRWVTVDVTRAVQRNGAVNLGLTTRSRHEIVVASREAGRESAPRLEIEVGHAQTSTVVEPAPVDPPTPAPVAPDTAAAPAISGNAWQGRTLMVAPGDWTGTQPIGYAYQWKRCDKNGADCVDITTATQPTYMLTAGDLGVTVRATVTATNAAGTQNATSAATDAVTIAPKSPGATAVPTVAGTAQEDHILSAATGKWTGATPMTFTYQWQRCDSTGGACTAIEGATGKTYTVTADDLAATIRVVVTGANVAAATTSASKPSRVVTSALPAFSGGLWHMDETTGSTMFDSVGTADGKLKGVKAGAAGVLGGAYSFNGHSQVTVGSKSLNPGTSPFSLTVHVNFKQKPSTAVGDYDLMRKGMSATSGGDYKMEILGGGNAFCYFRGSAGSAEVSGGGNLADGQWHTITCAKQDSKVILTVDGKTYSSSGKVGSLSNSASLLLGAQGGNIDPYTGLMDEVDLTIG
jgi:hypothetical protein